MRLSILVLAAMTAAPSLAPAQASGASRTPAGPAARALFALEDQWCRALIARDSAFFRRTLHPDYVYSDERGTFNKEQVIAEQVGGTDTVQYAANEDMRAHLHGDAAVVTGILVVRGRGQSGPFQHRYRYTDTWLHQNGRWVMIGSQDYDIPSR
jgi:ketosteroid isomerase-like protein